MHSSTSLTVSKADCGNEQSKLDLKSVTACIDKDMYSKASSSEFNQQQKIYTVTRLAVLVR